MKKFLLAAAFVTVCSFSSALAQTAVQTEKAAVATDVQRSEIAKEKPAAKAASCCSKKSKNAKACSDKEANQLLENLLAAKKVDTLMQKQKIKIMLITSINR